MRLFIALSQRGHPLWLCGYPDALPNLIVNARSVGFGFGFGLDFESLLRAFVVYG
jgi:hypothetical protein